MYTIVYTKQAIKDSKKISRAGLKNNVIAITEKLKSDPFFTPPAFEKLIGDLQGCYSRRINIQHRIVYTIYEKEKTIKILRMWTHYE